MKSTRSRVAVAIAVAAVVIAAIVAIAVSGGSGGTTATNASDTSHTSGAQKPRGDVALAAAYLGITRAQIHRELRAGRTLAQIASSTSGRSTAGLIAMLVSAKTAHLNAQAASNHLPASTQQAHLAKLRARITAEVNRTRTGHATLHVGGDLGAAASYLGVSSAQLRNDLLGGRSLAQVASSTHGRSTAGLIEAIVAARRAKLASAVAAGRLSQTQEQAALATLQRRVTAAVSRAPGARAAKGAKAKAEKTGEGAEPGEGAGGTEAAEGATEGAEA